MYLNEYSHIVSDLAGRLNTSQMSYTCVNRMNSKKNHNFIAPEGQTDLADVVNSAHSEQPPTWTWNIMAKMILFPCYEWYRTEIIQSKRRNKSFNIIKIANDDIMSCGKVTGKIIQDMDYLA